MFVSLSFLSSGWEMCRPINKVEQSSTSLKHTALYLCLCCFSFPINYQSTYYTQILEVQNIFGRGFYSRRRVILVCNAMRVNTFTIFSFSWLVSSPASATECCCISQNSADCLEHQNFSEQFWTWLLGSASLHLTAEVKHFWPLKKARNYGFHNLYNAHGDV